MSLIVTPVVKNDSLYIGYGKENFFGKLLGRPISLILGLGRTEILINGESFDVNTGSLQKHLESINLKSEHVAEVARLGYDIFIGKQVEQLPLGNELVVNLISPELRNENWKELVTEIFANNSQLAKILVLRQGAYIDKEFYCCDSNGIRIFGFDQGEFIENLKMNQKTFTYGIYTPLSLALEKRNFDIVRFIYDLKKDVSGDNITCFQYSPKFIDEGIESWDYECVMHREVSLTFDDKKKCNVFSFTSNM